MTGVIVSFSANSFTQLKSVFVLASLDLHAAMKAQRNLVLMWDLSPNPTN